MILALQISKRRALKMRDENFRRHTWGYIGAAAITVVGGAISSNQAKKKAGAPAAYQNVNLQQEQQDALIGNLGSQDTIEALLKRADSFSADQALSLEDKTMPGFSKLRSKLSETSTSLLDNPYDLPKDVQDNLGRIAAERGISAGTRGQFNEFSLLRDFGINSLQYGQQRIGQAQGIAGLLSSISPKVNPMSPLGFYVTPQQNAGNTTANNRENQAIQQDANNANAAAANANNATWANLINGATGFGADYLKSRKSGAGANTPAQESPTGYVTPGGNAGVSTDWTF